MTHLSLFSGIGGIDLAAEWAGFKTVAFVEQNSFCQKVLRKHWPEVPIHNDVRDFNGNEFKGVELLSFGFPCQNVSTASSDRNAKGVDGPVSGLYREAIRIARECEAKWLLAENVYQLHSRGLDRVTSDMEAEDYTVWPIVVGVGSAGAPHSRKRFFLVAHSNRYGEPKLRIDGEAQRMVGEFPADQWRACPSRVRRVDDGISDRMDRARALGNAVSPIQVYPVLRAIAGGVADE